MKRMKELRARRGMSLPELGRMTGLDYSVLSRYENGKRDPSVQRAALIAAALGVTLDFLVGDADESSDTKATSPAARREADVAPMSGV